MYQINTTLEAMLQFEENYTLNISSLKRAYSSKIKPEMRTKLATWMLEVCEEQQCTDEIYSLAMNMLDRIMCTMNRVEVYHLQLLGCVCLFLSSKLKSNQNNKHLDAFKLIEYTDNSINLEDLLEWELLCLDKLRWDIAALVANDFVDIFIDRLNLKLTDLTQLKKHCYAFTAMCSTDYKFAQYPASMIAGACIISALEGLNSCDISELYSQLNEIACIDEECLLNLKEQVDELFKQTTNNNESQTEESLNDSEDQSVNELNELLETNRLLNDIHFEEEYEFNLDYNKLELNSYEVTREVLSNLENSLNKTPLNNTIKSSAKKNSKSKHSKRSKRLVKCELSESAKKKKNIISPAKQERRHNSSRTSSRRSSSGVSSCATSNGSDNLYLCNSLSSSSLASLLSTASSNSSSMMNTNTNKYIMSMMYVSPPQANSLPMPAFDSIQLEEQNEKTLKRVSTRRKQSLNNNNNQVVIA